MRADAWNARTWLLAVVAGWAVLAALLALFGLGSRITPLPADPDLVQALPRLPATPPERLGVLDRYADVGARPLFSEDRRHKPFFLSGEEAAAPTFDLVLTSVLITPSLELAIVQPAQGGEGLRVKVGESPAGFSGWQLTELGTRRAVFDGPEGRRELELRVFDGTGGQPPTQVVTTPPRVPPAGVAAPTVQGARTTGGDGAAAVVPGATASVPGQASAPVDVPATSPSPGEPSVPVATADEQMEAIRQRIEQRRAQLRQQQAQPTTPPATPGKTQ